MSLEIANEDYAITITPGGGWTPGNPNYTIFKATKLKANAKFVLILHILWQMLNLDCVLAGYTLTSGGGIIMPTGTKCLTNGNNPLRRTDSGKCNGAFVQNVSPYAVILCNCNYEITNAGQSKAKCE
jgi:hypothetical protein